MRLLKSFSLIGLVYVVLAGALSAQVTGRLNGSVVDPSGAAVPGIAVQLMLPGGSRVVLSALTTTEGLFAMIGVPSGTYDLLVEAPGFRKHTERGVVITPAQATVLAPIKLDVGAVTEVVEVSASGQLVQTSNAEVSLNFTREQLKQLPVLNRSPQAFVMTQAGVSSGRGDPVINGQRTTFTNVTVDGINIQDNFIRTNAVNFSPFVLLLDQVAEFTVATSNASAASGGGASQVNFVTPSGTNSYHGSLLWQNRNNAVAANTWFNNRDGIRSPFLNQNWAGGTIAGPILKDRLLFYANYEAFRSSQQTAANRTLLTADARQGIFTYRDAQGNIQKVNILQAAGVQPDAATRAVLQQVPGPEKINNFRNGDSSEVLLRNTAGYSFNIRNNRVQDHLTAKLEFNLSPQHNFSGTYIWNSDIIDRPDVSNDYALVPKVVNDDISELISGGWRWNPTPRFTNEVRGGRSYAPVIFASSETFGAHILGVSTFANPLNTFRTQGRNPTTYNFFDNANYVRGAHNVQFGYHRESILVEPFNEGGITPTYNLGIGAGNPGLTNTHLPGASATDIAAANNLLGDLAGYFTSYSQTFNVTSRSSGFVKGAANVRHLRVDYHAGYFADTWKIRPRLTLNLGTRYEYFTRVNERDSLSLFPQLIDSNPLTTLRSNGTLDFAGSAVGRPFYGSDRNNIAPNVGLAWDPFGRGKTAVRAGYSVNFVNDEYMIVFNAYANANSGLNQVVTATGLSGRVSSGLPPVTTPAFAVPRTFQDNYRLNTQATFALAHPDLRAPYVQQWNIGVQHEFKDIVFDLRYVGNHGTKLFRGIDFNQVQIREGGFLDDFRRAQENGNLARTRTGVFDPNYNPQVPGSQPLTVFPRLVEGGRLNNAAIRNLIDQGQVGELATTYQTQRLNGPINFFPNPLALTTNLLSNYSHSTYNALQFDVRARPRAGLQFQANYTFSKVLSDASSGSENAFQNRNEALLDNDSPRIERSRAPFDLTHVIKGNYVYNLPFGDGRRLNARGLGRLVSGWWTSGILVWQSGAPFSVLSGRGTFNRGGQSARNTANTSLNKSQLDQLLRFRQTGAGPYFAAASAIGTDGRAVAPDGGQPFSGQTFFNPAAGTLGTLQRRMFSAPWAFNLDVALAKDTKITERHSLQLRAEASNIFNHPTWSVGDQTVTSTTFGRITSTRFGRRVMQFSLHYRF